MNIPALLLNRIYVLVALSRASGWEYAWIETMHYKGKARVRRRIQPFSLDQLKKEKPKYPVVLVIRGQGIVSKQYPAASEAARRITQNPGDFISVSEPSESGATRLTFMRQGQYSELMEALAPLRLPLISTRILASEDLLQEVKAAGEEFFRHDLTLRHLFRPTPENNLIAGLLTRRLMLPIMGLVLAALVGNFMLQRHGRETVDQLRYELSTLQKNASASDKEKDGQQKLHELFLKPPAYPYAFLADRIALVVPDGIMLTSLSIHPLMKKIQENKPLVAEANRILIRGACASASPVSEFADTLRTQGFTRQLRLLSMAKDRNNRYGFEIEIRL